MTRWNGKKYALPQGHGAWRAIADRLAAYEDTGLEPAEIDTLKARINQTEVTELNYENNYSGLSDL